MYFRCLMYIRMISSQCYVSIYPLVIHGYFTRIFSYGTVFHHFIQPNNGHHNNVDFIQSNHPLKSNSIILSLDCCSCRCLIRTNRIRHAALADRIFCVCEASATIASIKYNGIEANAFVTNQSYSHSACMHEMR